MEHRMIIAAMSVALTGAVGGYALGGFATGGEARPVSQDSWWSSAAVAADRIATPVTTGEPATDDGPERYVCRGCGPTLAERREQMAMADYPTADAGYSPEDLAPLPTYEPAAPSGQAVDLPDLGTAAH